MEKNRKVLTVQDISCFGQCSLTVALPIISACGSECAVLPSAVLSTHTCGFSGYTFRDLTSDMPAISAHWAKEGIYFDAVYTGYLGSFEQISHVADIIDSNTTKDAVIFIDPAMADNGKLYPGFDMEFVKAMRGLCAKADYLIPNISESCLLTDTEYKESYDECYIKGLLEGLLKLGCKNVILTGVSYAEDKTGVCVLENGKLSYYEHKKISKGCHGTGDIYASAFVGAFMKGKSAFESAKIAADYVLECIKFSQNIADHAYGASFEGVLYKLMQALN